MIQYDDFAKIDLRVAKILDATPVEGSEKLLQLKLDVGELGERQILAGIAKAYAPDQLIGRHIVIIANLEPRKLMGLESNGMLLAADGGEAGPVFLTPEKESFPGSKIK